MKTKCFILLLTIIFSFIDSFAQQYTGPDYLKIADFEDGRNCFTRQSSDISSATIINNPYQAGINTSSKVLEVVFNANRGTASNLAQDYRDAGWTYPIGNKTVVAEGKYRYAHFKVQKPITSDIQWSFRNATGSDAGLSPTKSNTTTNNWEYIVIDLLGGIESYHIQPNTNYVGFNLKLDRPTTGTGSAITVYVDDIYLSNSLEPINDIQNVINVVTGKTVDYFGDYLDNTSSDGNIYTGNYAIDGKITNASRWISTTLTTPHILEVDLEGLFTINSVAIYRDLSNLTQKMPQFSFEISNSTNDVGNDIWETVISVEGNTIDALYVKVFDERLARKVRFYVPGYGDNRVRLFELEVYGRPITTWQKTSADWNTGDNWDNGVPNATYYDVIIPKGAPYPSVPAGTTINNITFQPGAEIGNQHNLIYNKAFVQYDFSASRNRWNMLSLPLQEAYVGDFTFGGYPRTYLRKFKLFGEEGGIQYAGWDEDLLNDVQLHAGDGFILWLTNENSSDKGLGLSDGILELPYFDNLSVPANIHYTHTYVAPNSTFYNFTEVTPYEKSENARPAVARTNAAYKLAGASVNQALTFGHDDDYNSDFALVGNPFMTSIDFGALQSANSNSSKIKANYQVWTESGYRGFNPDGEWGVVNPVLATGMNQYIAPVQSFIVEKVSDNYTPGDLEFDISTISTTTTTGSGMLRSPVIASGNKLEITASNTTASVRTFVADRDGGQNTFGDKDARKLLFGISDTPEIYTLKTFENKKTAVGANIIHSNNILIPVGLATTFSGNIKLTFSGMNNYNARITFIDAENETVDLTGLDVYEYSFNHTPTIQSNEVVANENRFFIQIQPSPTGIKTPDTVSNTTVYSKNQAIYVVSDSSEPIKQILIYDIRGILVYADKKVNAPYCTIPCNASIPEVCIVKVITEQGVKNTKIVNK